MTERTKCAILDLCADFDRQLRDLATPEEALEVQAQIGDVIDILRTTASLAYQKAQALRGPVTEAYYLRALDTAGALSVVWPPVITAEDRA